MVPVYTLLGSAETHSIPASQIFHSDPVCFHTEAVNSSGSLHTSAATESRPQTTGYRPKCRIGKYYSLHAWMTHPVQGNLFCPHLNWTIRDIFFHNHNHVNNKNMGRTIWQPCSRIHNNQTENVPVKHSDCTIVTALIPPEPTQDFQTVEIPGPLRTVFQ